MKEEQIRAQAKKILDNFAKELDKIPIQLKKSTQKIGGFREESIPTEFNKEFKKLIFNNAPHKEGDFIIAEKKKWQ